MLRRISTLILGLLAASVFGFAQDEPSHELREPKGIYATFQLDSITSQAYAAAYDGQTDVPDYPYPALREKPSNEVVVRYLRKVLDDPNVSGLAPGIAWKLVNPNDPSDPTSASQAYSWEPLDDVFTAVDEWNSDHPKKTPKTIQLIFSPGFNSPGWVFGDIDRAAIACTKLRGGLPCTGDCDGLFVDGPPTTTSYSVCGYTTLFWETEGAVPAQIPLPLPWNPTYKKDWNNFLLALKSRVDKEPSSTAVVSIEIAGPTSSSTEMILPNNKNQKPYETGGFLVLPTGQKTIPNLTVADAWNLLLAINYGDGSPNYNSDGAFIQEWENAIDLYGEIFSGITLSLTTTTDSLPTFPQPKGSPDYVSAPGFESDCYDTGAEHAMACAAVTQVLAYFTDTSVGGHNAKATQENGLTARDKGYDLATNGIRWLAASTKDSAAPVLGGLQFGKSFSSLKPQGKDSNDMQLEGCPTYPTTCDGLTPAEGLTYVLSLGFFPGTFYAPTYGASQTVVRGHFDYTDAPMNFMQIYSDDILYAEGLSKCPIVKITGSPAFGKKPNTSKCALTSTDPSYADSQNTDEELEDASVYLLRIAEQVP
jgi:hypothetical protein